MADIELSVGLQKGSANTSQIKSELESMLKGLSGSKATKINIEPTISSGAFKEFQSHLTTSLNSISQSAAETTSALQQVSQVIQEINSKNFNINLNLDKTSLNADQVDRYKESVMDYAKSYQEAFKELARLQNAGAFRGSAGGKSNGALYEYQSQFSEIIKNYDIYIDRVNDINKRMSSVKTFTGAGTVAKDFQQYWNNIIPILEKANSLGISNFDLSKFKFPEMPKDLAQTATQMSGIFDQIAPGFKQSIEEMKTMLQSAVEEINNGLSNIGKGASTDGMKQAAESVKQATESAASSINAEKQALDQVVPSKSQVAAKEAEVAAQSKSVAESAQAAAAGIQVESNALDDQNRLYKKRATYFDENGNPTRRTTLYPGSSLGATPGYDTVVNEAYNNGMWQSIGSREIHQRASQYASAVKVWEAAELERMKILDQVSKLQAEMDRTGDPTGSIQARMDFLTNGQNGTRSLAELNALIPTLQAEAQLFSDLEQNSNAYASALTNLEKRRRDYAVKAAGYNHGTPDPLLSAGTKDYFNELTNIANLQSQIQSAQENWSAAKYGKTSASYNELNQLVTDLNQLNAGLTTMTKGAADQELARITARFRELGLEISNAGANHKSFFAQLTDFGAMFRSIVTPMRVAMAAVRVFKQAVRDTIELQNALVDLQIVTGASDKEFSSYTKDVVASAKEIGVATKDIITATTTYSRLGYSFDESNILAKYTTMLQKVGGIEAEDAQNAITAILKAFPKDADIGNIESVMDKLVTVGNNFPISVSQIAEGMNNASSTLAAAGNSFEQSVALLTAANTTIQNASRSSTGLRTITARLRNTQADLEELGETDFTTSKYNELVQALTAYKVSLTDINGEYRSTYDIMYDLASVWGTLTSQERAALATSIAGTRQQDVLNSLLSNFKEATGAMERMQTSQGALTQAYDIYMQSITAHINQFKAAFNGLGISVIGALTPAINAIIDIGAGILNAASLLTNALGPALKIVGVVLGTAVSGIGEFVGGLAKMAAGAPVATSALIALGAALSAILIINKSPVWAATPMSATILGVVAAVSALGAIVQSIKNSSLDGLTKQAEEAKTKYDSLQGSLEQNKARMQELESIRGTSSWSIQLDSELASLEAQNRALETQLTLQKKLYDTKTKEQRNAAKKVVDRAAPTGPLHLGISLKDQLNAYKLITESTKSTDEQIADVTKALTDYIDKVKDARDVLDPEEDAEYIKRIDDALAEVYEALHISIVSTAEDASESVGDTIKTVEELNVVIDRAKQNIQDLSTAAGEAFSSTGVTPESVQNITKIFGTLDGFDPHKLFEMTSMGVKMNADELTRLTNQYVELEKQNIIDSIKQTSRRLDEVNEKLKNLDETADDYSETKAELEKQRDTFESDIQGARAAYAEITALTNAYNQYLQAKSAGNYSDPYADIRSGYDDIKDYIKRGFYNEPVVTKYLDTVLGEVGKPGGRTGDNKKDANKISKKIKGTDYSILDMFTLDDNGKPTTEGVDNFVKALAQLKDAGRISKGIIKDLGNEQYELNLTKDAWEEVANATGMGYDALMLMASAMRGAGWDVEFEDLLNVMGEVEDKASEMEDENVVHLKFDTEGCDPAAVQAIIDEGIDGAISITLGKDGDLTVETQAENISKVIQGIGQRKIPLKLDVTSLVNGDDGDQIKAVYNALCTACGENGVPIKLNIDGLNTQTEGGMAALQEFFNTAKACDVPVNLYVKELTGEGDQVKKIEDVLGVAEGVNLPVSFDVENIQNKDEAIAACNEIADYCSENQIKLHLDLTSFLEDGGDLSKLNSVIEGYETTGITLTIQKAEGYETEYQAIVEEVSNIPGVVTVSATEDSATFESTQTAANKVLAAIQEAAHIQVTMDLGNGNGDENGEGENGSDTNDDANTVYVTVKKSDSYDGDFQAIVDEINTTPGTVLVSADENTATFETTRDNALKILAEIQDAANIKVSLIPGVGGSTVHKSGSGRVHGGSGGNEVSGSASTAIIAKAQEELNNAVRALKEYDDTNRGNATDEIAAAIFQAGYDALDAKIKEAQANLDNLTNAARQLDALSDGGNVDLLNRPIIDSNELINAGWEGVAERAATVFSSTFSNATGTIAANFTPIMVDEEGNYLGTLSPEELQTYAESVLDGAREDDLNLQIGGIFDGENAIEDAVNVAEQIHELQEQYYQDDLLTQPEPTLTETPEPEQQTVQLETETDTGEAKEALEDLNGTEIEAKVTADTEDIDEISEEKHLIEFELSDNKSRNNALTQLEELQDGKNAEAEYELKVNGLEEGEEGIELLQQALGSIPDITTCETTDNGTALSVKGNVQALINTLALLPTHKTITIDIITNGGVPGLATGTKNAPGGIALVNEEGPEIISDHGTAYIANGGKPALVNLSKGAIVLNADETRDALGSRGMNKSVNAYASGRYYSGGSTSSGAKQQLAAWMATGKLSNVKKDTSGGGYGGGGGDEKEEEEKKEKIDWIEVAVDRIERVIDSLADVVASSFKKLTTRLSASVDEVAKIQEEIELAQKGAERYFKEADSVGLSNALKEKARNGTIDINEYDKDTADQINEYLKWYEKGLDLQEKVAELHENIAEIYQDRFDMVQDDYENQLEELEHQIEMQEKNVDMVAARGYLESTKFYEAMSDIESKRLSMLKAEMQDLQKYFDEAMASGEIDEGSEAWYEMSQEINDVAEAIAEANVQLVEYEKTMRSIAWDTFDFVIDRFDQLSDEAEFFIDLMSNDELFDDRGQLNDAGMATLGMHSLNFNAFMQKADEYAKQLETINQMIEADPYDTELIERREELLSLQRDSIMAAEDEKNAVQDLISEGIDKELEALKELIDEYKESLDSAKDLYEYQEKLSEKSKDIASIQKQLAAYAGDTSEENRSRVQKLQQDLEKAQKELQEEERDHAIEDQKKLLDDLYDEYEELLNKRMDDVDKLMQDMIDMTNDHMNEIKDKLDAVAEEVGYRITEGMETALDGMFAYYDKVFTGITSISNVLDGIYNAVDAMAEASGALRAYSSGGIVDYTGLAMLHGTPGNPEMVLNPEDTSRFLQMVSAMHSIYDVGDMSSMDVALRDTAGMYGGTTIGSINLGIAIDHVQDYNDFVTQLRDDPKFEKLVQAMTLDQAMGKSRLGKNRINF